MTEEEFRSRTILPSPSFEQAKRQIDEVTAVAVSPGNAHADHYMRGMANGLILAQATVHGTEPKFIDACAVPPAFDYMNAADKTCSIVFGAHNIDRNGFVTVLKNVANYAEDMNLYKKLLFRGKKPEELGFETPKLADSLSVEWPHDIDQRLVDVIHGIVGVITEAGEAAEILIRMLESTSGQSFDAVNVAEEAGDIRWYIVRMLRGIGMTDEQCERMNIDKLHGRLGESFDVFRDANRDLAAERLKLEAAFVPPPAPLFTDPTERFFADIGTGSDAIDTSNYTRATHTDNKHETVADRDHVGYVDADAPIPPAKAMIGARKASNVGTEPPGIVAVSHRTPKGDCEGMDC